jgi:hypothetical protein
MDYYLKAINEEALFAALISVGAVKEVFTKTESGEIVETHRIPAEGYTLDVIGTIYQETGNTIQQNFDGFTFNSPELVALDGFHANLRGPADLSEKVEYIQYQPTKEELEDPNFVMPEPTKVVTPSPLAGLLVYPKTPSRVWF